jgi:hypothetical protein
MFAAVAGVLVVSSLATAQTAPNHYPISPARLQPTVAQNAGGPVTPAAGSVFVRGSGGCSSCASPTGTAFGQGLAPIQYGQPGPACANGCGSFKSTCGFMFGSCKSFFNPCGPLPLGGLRGGHGGKCPTTPFGTPYGVGYNACIYDTYLNH